MSSNSMNTRSRVAICVLVATMLPLGGCAGVVMGISAASGVVTFAKDVLDLDTSWKQNHPDKTPIDKALLPLLAVPAPETPK
jgi:uncharacterized protein YceK